MFVDERKGRGGETTTVVQDDVVTRLNHKKMLQRVRWDLSSGTDCGETTPDRVI